MIKLFGEQVEVLEYKLAFSASYECFWPFTQMNSRFLEKEAGSSNSQTCTWTNINNVLTKKANDNTTSRETKRLCFSWYLLLTA